MSDINRKKVEDSKSSKIPAASTSDIKPNKGIEVNFGNAEKLKILLLQAINNNVVELTKEIKELKELFKGVKEKE